MKAHRDKEAELIRIAMEKKLHGDLAGVKSVFDMDQAMKPLTKELADLERATKATKQETRKLDSEILYVEYGLCGGYGLPPTPESERPFHPDAPLEERQEWRREQKKWQPEKEALEATLLPVDNAIAASELKLSALLSTITISQGTVDTTVGEPSERMMALDARRITRTGFTVDIEQITKARESLIAALASKQAKLLELNSQVAQLSAGIEELEHLTQTNTDLNQQAKVFIGGQWWPREEELLLADLPCLDVEPSFDMASRELQSQLEAAKANFEKAKNSIPKKMEELKAVEAEPAREACCRMLGLCNGRTDFVTDNSLSWAADGSLCSNTASN